MRFVGLGASPAGLCDVSGRGWAYRTVGAPHSATRSAAAPGPIIGADGEIQRVIEQYGAGPKKFWQIANPIDLDLRRPMDRDVPAGISPKLTAQVRIGEQAFEPVGQRARILSRGTMRQPEALPCGKMFDIAGTER